MMRLIDKLKKNKMALIVSLPRNAVGLARAAFYGGADAVKVHINIHHAASHHNFGTFEQEFPLLEIILKSVSLPVGIVPGAGNKMATLTEMKKIVECGFDFLDVSHASAPHWMYGLPQISKMIAVNGEFSFDELSHLEQKGAEIIEAAIIPEKDYGLNLSEKDLANYKGISENTTLAVVVPTQKKITVADLGKLTEAGVRGLMIGIIVMGQTPASVEKTTREFKKAIASL